MRGVMLCLMGLEIACEEIIGVAHEGFGAAWPDGSQGRMANAGIQLSVAHANRNLIQ